MARPHMGRLGITLGAMIAACASGADSGNPTPRHSSSAVQQVAHASPVASAVRLVDTPAQRTARSAAPSGPPEDGERGRPLRARVLYGGLALGMVTALAADSDLIYAGNEASDSSILIFSTKTGKLLSGFGRQGDGPGEYRNVSSIQILPAASHHRPRPLLIFDGSERRVTWLHLLDPLTAKVDSPVTSTVNAGGPMTGLAMLPDSSLIGPGFFSSHRLARLRQYGTLLGLAGPTPDNPHDIPVPVLEQVYHSTLAMRPDGTALVLATRYLNHIEIYSADGSLRRMVEGPSPVEPEFTVAMAGGAPTMASNETLRFGYVAVAAGKRRIYALFSGRRRGDYAPSEATYGNQLHVFDWSGNLMRVVTLDRALSVITVSPDEHTLYAIGYEPEEALVTYDIGEMVVQIK